MDRFVQLHLLTSYPPSNLNRDDLGRPKTAMMGGSTRLRISSQSLKRAWRTSDIFEESLKGSIGTRTKEMGVNAYKIMIEKGADEKKAKEWAGEIAALFGNRKKKNKKKPLEELEVEQLVHFSPEEVKGIEKLAEELASGEKKDIDAKEINIFRKELSASDIALFGRMLTASPGDNVEASTQVAHAITIHKVTVEDDFFTAVDDLNDGSEDAGSAHMGETEFSAGLFYLYICVDRALLIENLNGDNGLWKKTLEALVKTSAQVAPTGKQNSFASRARASFILAERGSNQPRSLSVAFLNPVEKGDFFVESREKLVNTKDNIDKVYGFSGTLSKTMDAVLGEGSLQEIIDFVTEE